MFLPKLLRPVVALGAVVALTAGCQCLPGGGSPPTTTCASGGTIALGVPKTICLPELTSRVNLTFSPALPADTLVTVTCDTPAGSDLLVETSLPIDNYSCGSLGPITIAQADNFINFGVNVYAPYGGIPGEPTVTVTPVAP